MEAAFRIVNRDVAMNCAATARDEFVRLAHPDGKYDPAKLSQLGVDLLGIIGAPGDGYCTKE